MGGPVSGEMRYLILSVTGLFLVINGIWGHGAIYYPPPWTATSDCNPEMSPKLCKHDRKIPPTNCTVGSNACSRKAGRTAWFTNFTSVPERTINEEMFDIHGRRKSKAGFNPWNSPGAAPIFGDGCGVNGGNPNGCDNEDFIYGRCCGGNPRKGMSCGGYVGGKPALEYYEEGFFGSPTLTTWKRGRTAEVYWKSGMKHRGGYAYRLCKVENGKVWRVTEKCFQNGHLKFAGKTTWIYYMPATEDFSVDGWQAQDLITTTIGTTPEGSEWAKIDLPKVKDDDDWAIKNLVRVPKSLEPGEYVLSFRWDCQQTPQVWNSCANILVK